MDDKQLGELEEFLEELKKEGLEMLEKLFANLVEITVLCRF